jgi:hypothetical protein
LRNLASPEPPDAARHRTCGHAGIRPFRASLNSTYHPTYTKDDGGATCSSCRARGQSGMIVFGKERDRVLRGEHLGRAALTSICGVTGVRNDPRCTSGAASTAHVAPAVVDGGLTARSHPRFPRLAESVFKRAPRSPAAAPPVRQNRRRRHRRLPALPDFTKTACDGAHTSLPVPSLKSCLATSGARRQT